MGKIANLMDTGIAGLTDALAFRHHPGLKDGSIKGVVQPERQPSLPSFIFGEKQNRSYFFIAFVGALLQFIFFKFLYPLPDFISDSYSYIDTNLYHMDVNLWPIGYSKFLWLAHLITPSHTFLIFIQYIILEISLIYFFYSILFLYPLSRTLTTILFVFLFFNPIFLYLSNCVLSDAIFCALSIILFTEYLWMYKRFKTYYIYSSAILIGILFTLRYTAIYYPFVGAIAFLLSKQVAWKKLLGIVLPWMLIIPFIYYTQQKTKQITGTPEFSVFGGWQLANNALYMYDHIKVDTNKLPAGTLELDRTARQFFHDYPPENRRVDVIAGTYFIKVPVAILKPYMKARYPITHDAQSQFKAWGMVSPVYNKYGAYLIKHYPLAFAKYYLWLNTQNYFIPHLEKFSNYNLGKDSLGSSPTIWFQLKDSSVDLGAAPDLQNHIFYFYPVIFMMLNLYFAVNLLFMFFGHKLKSIGQPLYSGLLLTASFLFINFCFSVFATPVVLRYQVFPMILLLTFSLILFDRSGKAETVSIN